MSFFVAQNMEDQWLDQNWNSLDLTRWKPTLAIVELVTYGLPDISEQVVSLVVNSGYTMIHQSVHNGIFKSNG